VSSIGNSPTWHATSRLRPQPRISEAPKTTLLPKKRAEKALFVTYRHILPRAKSHPAHADCARFLGDDWAELAAHHDLLPCVRADAARDARGAALADVILDLLPPTREVIYARAIGMSWRAVQEHLPRRAYHSILEDWDAVLRWLAAEYAALTAELAQ
jgi:hypothetical protein